MNSTLGRLFGFPATFSARIASAAGGSLLAFIVARQGGPAMLGQFALFTSLLGTAGILARRGLDTILIRTVATQLARERGKRHVGGLAQALRMSLGPSVLLSLAGALVLALGVFGPTLPGSAVAFVLALPLLTGLALVSGYMKGVGRPWVAPLFDIGGISAVASVLLLVPLPVGLHVAGAGVLFALVVAMALVALAAWALLRRDIAAARTDEAEPPANPDEWRGQRDFTLIALSAFMLQAGSFALAAPFLTDAQLGLVRGAERLAVLVSFPVLAINPFIAARIVHHLVEIDREALRITMRRAMLTGGLLGAVPLLAYLIAPTGILGLLGARFDAAAPYLIVMALANFAIVLFGPSAMAMNMGGLERRAMTINVTFLVLGLVLFPLLSRLWGAAGFTAAYAIIAVSRTGFIFFAARRLLLLQSGTPTR